MTRKKALIIGGGIAGPVTAMALQRAGIDPVVYEAYGTSAGLDAGAFLTVAVNGLDALRTLDAHEPVLAGRRLPHQEHRVLQRHRQAPR